MRSTQGKTRNSHLQSQLVILLPPGVDEEEDPGEAKDKVSNKLARPVARKVLEPALEVDAPERHGEVEEDAALGEEDLEVTVPDEGDHEQEEADRKEQQAGEGVRRLDQELVVGRRAEELACRFAAVPDS